MNADEPQTLTTEMRAAIQSGGDGKRSTGKDAKDVLPSGMNTNVFDYLDRLPPEALDKLYGQDAGGSDYGQWTCRAILQSLPQLAKQHVMRLLFVEGFVDKGLLKTWVKKEYQRVHAASVRKVRL